MTLDTDWLTEGIFDFEYKKYRLLAYLQTVERQFGQNRLYPHLPELQAHYHTCTALRASKQRISASFPKRVVGVDATQWQLMYEETVLEDVYLADLNATLDFAIPRLSRSVDEGTDKFSEVGESILISPLGIVPLRVDEGYLLFVGTTEKKVSVFRYQLALYNQKVERGLKTSFVDTFRTGIGRTVEQVKIDLVKTYTSWPNPAAYVVECKYDYPLHETLLPVAKERIARYLSVA
jgi:hypothetical protein